MLAVELVKFNVPLNWIALGVYSLLIVGLSIVTLNSNLDVTNMDAAAGETIQIIRFQMNLMPMFLAVVIIYNVGREFGTGTVKKNIIDGLKRGDWVTGKVLTAVLIFLAFFGLGLILYFGVGSFVASFDAVFEKYGWEAVCRDFLVMLYNVTLILAIALLTRTIILGFICYLFLPVLEGVLNIVFQAAFKSDDSILLFLPSNAKSLLIEKPIDNMWMLLVPTVYFTLFLVVPYLFFKRKDLK